MTPQSSNESGPQIISLPSEPKKTPPSIDEPENDQTESQNPPLTPRRRTGEEAALRRASPARGAEAMVEVNGRERLKRHRVQVAGRVWIPDIWGQEELLKDWIDCTAFDASLVKSNIMSARAALAEEGRVRANSNGLRIENGC